MSIEAKQTHINTPKVKVSNKPTMASMHIPCSAVVPDTTIAQRCLGVVYNISANWETGHISVLNNQPGFSNLKDCIISDNRPGSVEPNAKARFSYPVHRVSIKNDEGITEATTYINTSTEGQNVYIKTRDTAPFVVKPTDLVKSSNKLIRGVVEGLKVFDARQLLADHLYVVKSMPVMSTDLEDLGSYINVLLNRKVDASKGQTECTTDNLYTSSAKEHIKLLRSMIDSYKSQIQEHNSTISAKLDAVSSEASKYSTLGVVYIVYEIPLHTIDDLGVKSGSYYLHNLDVVVSMRKFNRFDDHPAHSVIRSEFTAPAAYLDKVTPQINTGVHYVVSANQECSSVYFIDVDSVYELKPTVKRIGCDTDLSDEEGQWIEVHRDHYRLRNTVGAQNEYTAVKKTTYKLQDAIAKHIVFTSYEEAASFLAKRDLVANSEHKKINADIALAENKTVHSQLALETARSNLKLEHDAGVSKMSMLAIDVQRTMDSHKHEILKLQQGVEQDRIRHQSLLAENETKIEKSKADAAIAASQIEKAKAQIEMLESEKEHLHVKQHYAASTAKSESVSALWKIVPATIIGAAGVAVAIDKFRN